MPKIVTIITCEHASCRLPKAYSTLFSNAKVLESHQGWDIGAARVAKAMAKEFSLPLHLGQYSRLLIDLNRSVSHRQLFSQIIQGLSQSKKQKIIEQFYIPYREQVIKEINAIIKKGHIVHHISVHSFTPVLNGKTRQCDIGLLYDPKRASEKQFASSWQKTLKETGMSVRLNYPYRGISDGFVTGLRRLAPQEQYMGIELEMNQRFFENNGTPKTSIIRQILNSYPQSHRHHERSDVTQKK